MSEIEPKDFKKVKEDLDINLYDKIFDLRKFEIENFWKRTLFFWGTIAIIYAGYFKAEIGLYLIILPLMGVLFNLVFSFSIRGSKYWQAHWESMASEFERNQGFELFGTDKMDEIAGWEKSRFTKPYRFSVSKLTMLLSDLSVILWVFLWFKELFALIHSSKCFTFEHFGICLIHIALIGYFVLFLKKGDVLKPFKKAPNE